MKELALRVFLVLLVISGYSYRVRAVDSLTKTIKTGKIIIQVKGSQVILTITKPDGTNVQNVLFTKNPDLSGTTTIQENCESSTTCVNVGSAVHTKIITEPDSEIVKISRVIDNPGGQITDCYRLASDTQWFGGPQLRYQHWPIQNMYYEEEPYIPTHPNNMALAERYWLSSKGIYIFVDDSDPLFLDQNNYRFNHLCLIAKNKAPYHKRDKITLNYEIGVFADPRLAHEYVIDHHFGKPTGHPNERMVAQPIWSTWARYKVFVNESVVREFANEILTYKFNNSQLEIDDNWETCYGSAKFDTNKFPDIRKLLEDLKQLKFRVTLWIHPFINKECTESYNFALENNYLIKSTDGNVKAVWWQGEDAGAVDFTNPDAVEWWVSRLKELQDLGIDSFKFDAGEESFLPQPPQLTGPTDLQPAIYTHNYTSNLAKHFDDNIEARVGWRTQTLPIFVRMIDKDTRWTWNNGLPTLITTLIQMNLNGYVFVLPDMIGGNGYVNNSLTGVELPPKNMFIRWLQANVFMPSLQYSFVPWDFDNETIELSKKFTDLHEKIAPTIVKLMKKSVETGAPLNPPIWWLDPTNNYAHQVNDEYLLGEEILVAPVIEENAKSRDVYLPAGKWQDGNTQVRYTGPVLIKNYPAPLDVLPYFYKI